MRVLLKSLCALLLVLAACTETSTLSPTNIPLAPSLDTSRGHATPSPVPTSAFIEATPDSPLNVRGIFVYAAGDGSLSRQDAETDAPVPLVERAKNSIAQLPAFLPDGKRIAYSALLFLPDGNLRGDVRVVDLDGRNVNTLLEADATDVVYLYPRFAQNGRMLITRAEKTQTIDERARLEWLNAAGDGKRMRVIDDARDGDVSLDGQKIAFIRLDVLTARSSLWLANADGSGPKELVDDETFTAIFSPRFSPDGNWLAFSVHGAAQKSLPLVLSGPPLLHLAASEEDSCLVSVLLMCFLQSAHAHSAPGALWRMNLETGAFQQLTDIYDDSPMSAWSTSGTQIAIHDFTGIRLIDLGQHKIYPLFLEDGGNGGFDWHE